MNSREEELVEEAVQKLLSVFRPAPKDPDPARTILERESELRSLFWAKRKQLVDWDRRENALIPHDDDHAEALAVLSEMRLKLSKEDQYYFAFELTHSRRWVRGFVERLFGPDNNNGQLKKLAQFRSALTKAMRIYDEMFFWELNSDLGYNTDCDPLPQCEISNISRGSITFFRDKDHDAVWEERENTLNLWPIQIMKNFCDWASEEEAAVKQASETVSSRIQGELKKVAELCRDKGIKVSATESSQFYQIAAYIAPNISDMKYRIRKLLREEKGGKKSKKISPGFPP